MKTYNKTWKQNEEINNCNGWSQFTKPMSLKIAEEKSSKIFITASLEFSKTNQRITDQKNQGSLYYKILVNGEKLVEYHVVDRISNGKSTDVSLHGVSEIPPGENTIEVQYKVTKNGSLEFLDAQKKRHLSVLSFSN